MDERIIEGEEEEMNCKNYKKTRKLREAEKHNKVIRREIVRKEKGKHKMKMGKYISKEYTKPRDNKIL